MSATATTTRVDLRTRYLGLELRNPIVAAASPLTGSVESLLRLQEAGAAVAVRGADRA